MSQANLIIFESPNGRDNWKPLPPDQVPEWVKNPDILGQLVAGEICMDAAIGDKGSPWYRAEMAPTEQQIEKSFDAIKAAEEKRVRKCAKRLMSLN